MQRYLIKNGTIVRSSEMFKGSIEIADGKIIKVYKENEALPEIAEIDASGKLVFPGFLDSHVHMNEPGKTDREDISHATAAAAVGGITTVMDMPNSNNPVIFNAENLELKKECITKSANVDVAAWGALVNYNLDKLEALNEAGVKVFKSFLCEPDTGYTVLSPEEIREAMKTIKSFGGVAGFHCENYPLLLKYRQEVLETMPDSREAYLKSRPVEVEYESAMEVIAAAKETGCTTYICHTSHPSILEEIDKARKEGFAIYAETCPHYLIFTNEMYLKHGGRFKCCPPIRDEEARKGLLQCLKEGKIHTIGSDHCPVPAELKDENKYGYIGLFNGMAGIQSGIQASFDYLVTKNQISPMIFAGIFSTNIAKIFGLYGRKGDICEGFDADITIIDPGKEWTVKKEELLYVNKFSAYDECSGTGCPVMTILRGEVIAKDGKLIVENHGCFAPADKLDKMAE